MMHKRELTLKYVCIGDNLAFRFQNAFWTLNIFENLPFMTDL